MDQYSEDDVKSVLTNFHSQIVSIVRQAFSEWLAVQEFRTRSGFGAILYPRTIANYVFDGIARYATSTFDGSPGVRVINEPQTIKVCFHEVVVARFKKGDGALLGRNIVTQAFLDFVDPQRSLPNLPPEAAKVEFIYVPDDLGVEIGKLLVVARDHDTPIWAYELDPASDGGVVVPLPFDLPPDDDDEGEPLVAPKKGDRDEETK